MISKNKQTFFVSLAGGVLGALLIVGGVKVVNGNFNALSDTTVAVPNNTGTTKLSTKTYQNSTDVTKAVAKVQPAVVSVVNLQKPSANRGGNDLFSKMFGGEESADISAADSDVPVAASQGSGLVYKKDGNKAYIVTNAHVVAGQQGLEIVLSDGTKLEGKLVGSDSYSDLAVISVDSSKIKAVGTFADSSKLTVGEVALAIGSPLGLEYAGSVTQGIVSATNRQVSGETENGATNTTSAIQTDAAINPGNSGGPLINIEGQVIGINSSKLASTPSSATQSTAVEGMGFAIPANDVVSLVNKLEKDGKVVHPALGISNPVPVNSLSKQQLEKMIGIDPGQVKEGVVIAGSVASATPADAAGLEKYDVIVDMDGKKITDYNSLLSELYKHNVGDTVKVTYYHKKEKKTVDIKLTLEKEESKKKTTTQK